MESKKILLGGIECYGGNGNFNGELFITSKKYEALDKETQNKIGYKANQCLDAIKRRIERDWVKKFKARDRQEHVTRLIKLFTDAGFGTIHVKTMDNQYSGDAWYYDAPWIVATTTKGPITIGWRKRVINIDWSNSDIVADGEILFEDEKTTSGKQFVHAWDWDKAVEYLKRLLETETK